MSRPPLKPRALLPLLAAIAIATVFIALNHSAYDGYFQDDELDNLRWAPVLPIRAFVVALFDPRFQVDNFRPVGHLYFALMGRAFGLDFPPYMTPIFVIHLLNALLLYMLMRKLGIDQWRSLGMAAFFTLSTTAFDAYWKPMYVFDLLCTTFSLASILCYAYRRWIMSFAAFWLAYKAKELAVMLPVVLILYEYWFGERKFRILIPFVLVSLSFGMQGILRNPNKDNDYTLHFTVDALWHTIPFYARRLLMIPLSGLALLLLALLRDRRVWFALSAMTLVLIPLLVLPGRLFEAYTYLPLAFAAVAIAAASTRVHPAWLAIALALWTPFNIRQLHRERRDLLASDDHIFAFVSALDNWSARNPAITQLIYDGVPYGFHHWGVTAAWSMAHSRLDVPAFFAGWPEAVKSLSTSTVAYAYWDPRQQQVTIKPHSPL